MAWATVATFLAVYGRVEQVPVTIPTTNYPGVVAWVMLLSSDAQSWAQIGWASSIQNGRETFSQVKESGYFHTYFNSPPVDSQYPYFTVFYNNTPGKFTFQVDNNWWTPRGSGGYQPPANFVPYEGNAGGEITNLANQLPGTVAAPAGFFDLHVFAAGGWLSGGGYMQSIDQTKFGTDPALGQAPYYNTQAYIWDKACAS